MQEEGKKCHNSKKTLNTGNAWNPIIHLDALLSARQVAWYSFALCLVKFRPPSLFPLLRLLPASHPTPSSSTLSVPIIIHYIVLIWDETRSAMCIKMHRHVHTSCLLDWMKFASCFLAYKVFVEIPK